MLTKFYVVGGSRACLAFAAPQRKLALLSAQTPHRSFRDSFKSPYTNDPTPMSTEVRETQLAKPVWERVFDHQRYMKHQGPLKLSTGIAFLDVEPFPRMKLMKLYYLALQEINELPDEYNYKILSREMTRYRMKVVDENESIRAIEEQIGYGMIEELIMAAHNEVKLLRLMKNWQPWDFLFDDVEEDRRDLHEFANVRANHPFNTVFETYDDMRHDKTPRSERRH